MLATTKEVAESMRVSTATVYRMMSRGDIPQELVTKIGGDWRYNLEGIEEHLLQKQVEPPVNP